MKSIQQSMQLVLADLQQKYKRINMIMTLTQELEKAFSMGDEPSLSMLIEMRQKEMDQTDKLDAHVQTVIRAMEPQEREHINNILNPRGNAVRLGNPLETNLFDTNKRNLQLLERIIALNATIYDKMEKSI